MIEAIASGVPDYASPARPDYRQRLADAVTGAVACFIAHVARPDQSTQAITAEFRAIGGTAAREGRTLDALQDALRLGARVAWRWLCEADAGLDRRELSRVGEAIFAYLDELAAACAQGYAEARVQAAGDRQRRLLADRVRPATPRRTPGQPGPVGRLGAPRPGRGSSSSAGARTGSCCRPACSPTGPARSRACSCRTRTARDGRRAIDRALSHRALRGRPAAIGPFGAASPAPPCRCAGPGTRWRLARSGVIPAGPVRCDQHLSTLLILADEDLAAALRGRRLAPLARLRPAQRDRIAETLLAWLQLGENAAEVAQRIHVHPQTVRYRMRQIQELFGDQLRDPDRRFELQLALRIRTLAGRREPG